MCTSQRSLVNLIQRGKTLVPRQQQHHWCEIQPCLYSHPGCSRQPILHHFPGSIRYNQQISLCLGGSGGLHPCPGIKTGTCGRKGHSISSSQVHIQVPKIPQPFSLAVTLQQQNRKQLIALQLCIL